MTLRESIQAEIAKLEGDLSEKHQALVNLESTAAEWLGKEVDAIKEFFGSVRAHLGL